jgi:hypothetical protein
VILCRAYELNFSAAGLASFAEEDLDQVLLLLRKAFKPQQLRSQLSTSGDDLSRTTVFQPRQNCAPMTAVGMENCGLATYEAGSARIVAVVFDPKVVKALPARLAVRLGLHTPAADTAAWPVTASRTRCLLFAQDGRAAVARQCPARRPLSGCTASRRKQPAAR